MTTTTATRHESSRTHSSSKQHQTNPDNGHTHVKKQQSLKIWVDGKLLPKEEAKVSVYDHGLLYGDGVFEGIRVYNGSIFECQAHVDRLYASAKAIRLTIPYSPADFTAAMEETVRANGFVSIGPPTSRLASPRSGSAPTGTPSAAYG